MSQTPEACDRDGIAGEPAFDGLTGTQAADRTAGIARLAHELRTPLAAIAALSEVMRDERLGPLADPRYRAYAADIHHSANQALAVLGSYLEAGGHMAEHFAMSFAELAPREEAERAISAMRAVAERSGVTLALASDPALPHLIADRRSLRQILDNLVANAVKFTPPGGTIRVLVRHALNGPLEIAVVDDGDGMDAADLVRLLDRCAAPDRVVPRRGGGGIGLPLVRALAVANGGDLSIESERGRGTCVTVTFGRERLVPI